MQLAECSDLELVEALRLNREGALDELYRRHSASVSATARMTLGNASACDDVVAEVFLALWLRPEIFDPKRGSLLGYLRLKARGRSIDLVRSEVARTQRERNEAFSNEQCDGGPEWELLAAEASGRARKALQSLSEREREPIELAFFGGMTYRDVASSLELPEGTVKARIRNGLRHVKFHYENEREWNPALNELVESMDEPRA
jgi:RNA polymerase sigma-70 factor (ECF subfamily)